MAKPLISIVICCHNRADFLPPTMASVFNQSYRPVEILVVDDGSTDETPKLMASYGSKIRYYWQKNQGVTVARTAGGRLAKGEFIVFHDDDDLMARDRIDHLYGALCKYPGVVLSVGDRKIIDKAGKQTGEWLGSTIYPAGNECMFIRDGYRAILRGEVNPLPHTTLFRKTDGERIGWFDLRFFHGCEDTDFFLRISELGPIVYVPEVVCYYRRGHKSLTKEAIFMQYSRFLYLEKHLKLLSRDDNEIREMLRSRLRYSMGYITFHKKRYKKQLKGVPNDYVKRGLKLFSTKHYLLYRWTTLIKHPIRRFIYTFMKEKGYEN